MIVKFYSVDVKLNLKDRKRLKQFMSNLFSVERVSIESLTYVFCSDEYLLSINKQFLNHDTYTDIITFCLSEVGAPIVGEIYISIDRIRENALQLNNGIREELHRVIFHGALHLCGLKDKNEKERQLMRIAENKYLQLYFIDDSTNAGSQGK